MKRWFSILLAGSLILSMAACGGKSASDTSASAGAPADAVESVASTVPGDAASAEPEDSAAASVAEAPESAVESAVEPAVDGPLTMALEGLEPVALPLTEDSPTYEVWMAAPGIVSQTDDLANTNETYVELQKRTGVNMTFQIVNFFAQQDQFNLMAASGDFPAIMNGAALLYTAGSDAAIEQDIFLNLGDYAEYMPNYLALIHAREGLFDKVSTPEGNLVAFYSLFDYDKFGLGDRGYLIRLDWLNDLGLSVPKTYDQLHEVLTAFKEQKGADSAFVLPVSGMDDSVLGGFGVGQTFYVDDGTIKFGPMEEGFREYLQLMHQWYAEGLIYADYFNYANQIMFDGTDMIAAGQVGLYYNETGTMISYGELSGDPNFLVRAQPPVGKTEEDPIYMTQFTPSYVDNARWTITTNCVNPEIPIAMADYLYSEEGILLANYGIEGLTFEYDENGKPQLTDLIMNNPDGYSYRDSLALHVNDALGSVFDPLRGASGYTELQLSSWDDWTDANVDYSRALPSGDMLNVEEKSQYAAIYSDIDTFLSEAITKYIIGDMSFDTYDTEFLGKLESMNIQTCIDLYQTAYDRYMETH